MVQITGIVYVRCIFNAATDSFALQHKRESLNLCLQTFLMLKIVKNVCIKSHINQLEQRN